MTQFTVHQAKTQLSKLIAAAERGEEIVIARRDKPAVRLVAVAGDKPQPVFGAYKGQFSVGPEFFEPLPDDELALWNGEDS